MKKRTIFILTLAVLAMIVLSTPGYSQSPSSDAVAKLRQDAGSDVEITWNPQAGTASFIRGHIPLAAAGLRGPAIPATAAAVVVDRYAGLFGVKQAARELNVVQTDADKLGMKHVTQVQMYQGVEVYGALMKVHLSADGREVVAISSGFIPDIQLSEVRPHVSAEQALATARKDLPNGVLLSAPKLVVYPGQGKMPGALAKLAWLVELRDDAMPARNLYVVDAIEGGVLDVLNRLYEEVAVPQTRMQAPPVNLVQYNRIGIEAGHSESDAGSMSCNGQWRGADNTIAVANLAADILRSRGYTVDIFRGGNTQMQGYLADVFVSLHNDYCASGAYGFKASRYGGAAGTGVNGSGDASDQLVQIIWDRYERATGMARDTASGHFTSNMRFYYALGWIDGRTPGAIVEMGWWSGDENMLLHQRGVLAAGVAESILMYLGNADVDDGRGVGNGQTLSGNIDPASDIDTYYFDGSNVQRGTIQMRKNTFTPSLDSYLILYNPDGGELTRDDDSGGDRNALINRVSLPQTGRYRLEAKSYGGSSTGLYSLTLALQQPGVSSRMTYNANHTYSLPGTLARSDAQPALGDHDVDNAHDFAGATYNYYWNTHSRDSYDSQGATIISTAHYGRNYQNAFWNGTQMVYGDNFPVNDVVAHELTHAVTEKTANLEYRWQSGALNESISDIFGAMVDRDDWLMGEDLPSSALGGREAIRDLSNPKRFGQPDNVSDWVKTCSDNQGVHTNSGIPNKAFYNIATAIGKDKAERIFYRSLTTYLQSTSSLEDARASALQSAQDLYGSGGTEYNGVRDGFNAVGLDGQWNPPSNDCTCGASVALTDQVANLDQAAALKTMTTLYRVRDQLLSTTVAGQRYRALYDRNTLRISYLLLLDSSLRASGSQVLRQVTSGLNQLMDGRGDQTIVTQEMVADATSFLQRLAEADRARGGGRLALTIEQEMTHIDKNRLIGMTFKDAWAYINSRNAGSTIYLPMIGK